jgi:hypothetical protein
MRIRTGLGVLICRCAALTACTAAAPKGPDPTVTTPAVGRPPPPTSPQAALSGEAFTPYAALGWSNNDGLAPGESGFSLDGACMTAEGYPGPAAASQVGPSGLGDSGLAFGQPSGAWGYLGAADAQQYGFLGPGPDPSAEGLYAGPAPNFASLPKAEQASANKCYTIEQDFANALNNGPLAGVGTLSNDIATDVQHDPAVQAAARVWSASMAKNGYSFGAPQTVWRKELTATYPGQHQITLSTPVSASANRAQLAAAVTDAGCTQFSDLAGIYFAVQASYEHQVVNANQQALGAAVSQYRAAYAKELKELPRCCARRRPSRSLRPSGPAPRQPRGLTGKAGPCVATWLPWPCSTARSG